MSDQFVAEIRIFPFNFAPNGWAWCNGQILPISQNTALFSLLGTMYGGDGKSTFALPDLQGSVPIQSGQGPGLSDYDVGSTGGTQTVTLLTSEIPTHSHMLSASTNPGTVSTPSASTSLAAATAYVVNPPSTVPTNPYSVAPTGGNSPHNNMQPYLALAYCIALQGIYPARPVSG
jgi:microcystin-dependent protein